MRLPQIERKAQALNIPETHKYSKRELIRLIQQTEGNTPCFSTSRRQCHEISCCWRSDCR